MAAAFANSLEVSLLGNDGCVVTLPLKTADARYVDVFVERMTQSASFMYVHDGGKSMSDLYAQGLHPTDTQSKRLKGIADAHGASLYNGRFQILCKSEADVQRGVFAIAQCATAAMVEVVTHSPEIEEESLSSRVGRALGVWRPEDVEIRRHHHVTGQTGMDYKFDFVSMPISPDAGQPVALKLLPPSVGPTWQATRYGFMVHDIRGREAAYWPRLAIVSRSEEWSAQSLDVVRSLSSDVILLKTGEDEEVERILPFKMTELSEAA